MKVTLKYVEKKSISEPTFFKKLLANPDQTLKENRIELSAADRKRLNQILALDGKSFEIDLGRLIAQARRRKPGGGAAESLLWMGIWELQINSESKGLPASTLPL